MNNQLSKMLTNVGKGPCHKSKAGEVCTLKSIGYLLKHGNRGGAEVDAPEGSRYLQISDTLAALIGDFLLNYERMK